MITIRRNKMNFDEFKTILKSDEAKQQQQELLENALGTLEANPIAFKKLITTILNMPFSIREQIFWNKFYNFLQGVYLSPEDAIKLSNRLFGNEIEKRRNGMRLFEYIGKIDTEECLQFMINATRSLLLDLINVADYFRIVKAITETLYEDLKYLSEHIIEEKRFTGNTQILALTRSGLMIEAGIDGNADVENQEYVFTRLGMSVDRFAISFENDKRYKWHKNKKDNTKQYNTGIETITKEDIDKLFV